MKTDLTEFFNARELEILALLGFQDGGFITVEGFLKTIVIQNRPSDLHDRGVALRSVRAMLRKIKPDDAIFHKTEDSVVMDEEIEQFLNGCGI